jgi:hypothetical protein
MYPITFYFLVAIVKSYPAINKAITLWKRHCSRSRPGLHAVDVSGWPQIGRREPVTTLAPPLASLLTCKRTVVQTTSRLPAASEAGRRRDREEEQFNRGGRRVVGGGGCGVGEEQFERGSRELLEVSVGEGVGKGRKEQFVEEEEQFVTEEKEVEQLFLEKVESLSLGGEGCGGLEHTVSSWLLFTCMDTLNYKYVVN